MASLFAPPTATTPLRATAPGLDAGATGTDLGVEIETVAVFNEAMPTGVSVSRGGRRFVCYPRWGDPVPFTVAELVNNEARPFPNAEINLLDLEHAEETFVSVQSVVVDGRERLWVLDTGRVEMGSVVTGGPKLVAIDLSTNRVVKRIRFGADVVLPSTYLNDVRFDLRRGMEGAAYITDSSEQGPNGIIVVDLASGRSWRRLHDHPSTKAEPQFIPEVEGKPLLQRPADQPARPISMGADGIAISADGARLFYCPLASRRLFSVLTNALLDARLPESDVANSVRDEGLKSASDGLESDAEGRIYATDYEHNAIHRRLQDGTYETLVHDPRVLWPDTLSLAGDGYLYFTANQLHRQASYQGGHDLRVRPFGLYRVKTDGTPIRLV